MQIEQTTVPGKGVLHQFATRHGERFGVLVESDGDRHLFLYGAGDRTRDADMPARDILLESDEADQVAEVLRTRPITDRLLSLERRIDELIGERGR